MEYQTIGGQAFAAIILMMVLGVVIPVAFAAVWKRKTKDPVWVMLVGAGIFALFALVLESIPKLFLFQESFAVGRWVMGKTFRYVGAGALLAGIFEETGRWTAFRFFLKKRTDKKTAISYGIGHGGFEMMFLFVYGGLQNLLYAVMINSGQFGILVEQVRSVSPEQIPAMEAIPASIASLTVSMLGISVLERISAMIIHISCSVLVFRAVREKGKWWMYPLAILLHASIDVIAGLYQTGVIKSVLLTEGILFVWAVSFAWIVYQYVYKKWKTI